MFKNFKENIIESIESKILVRVEEKRQELSASIFNEANVAELGKIKNSTSDVFELWAKADYNSNVLEKIISGVARKNNISPEKLKSSVESIIRKSIGVKEDAVVDEGILNIFKKKPAPKPAPKPKQKIATGAPKKHFIESSIDEAMAVTPKEIEFISNSLNDKEWLVLGIILGFKPNYRRDELKRISSDVDYSGTISSLEKKKAVGKGGKTTSYTRSVWEKKWGNVMPSQIHQWSNKLNLKEETEGIFEASWEKNLDPNKPIVVKGVKGMKNAPFTKKFKNQSAFEKWSDSEAAGDYEIKQVMNEDVVSQGKKDWAARMGKIISANKKKEEKESESKKSKVRDQIGQANKEYYANRKSMKNEEIDEAKLNPEEGQWHVIHPENHKIISTHKGYAGANAKMKKLSYAAHSAGQDSGYTAMSAQEYERRYGKPKPNNESVENKTTKKNQKGYIGPDVALDVLPVKKESEELGEGDLERASLKGFLDGKAGKPHDEKELSGKYANIYKKGHKLGLSQKGVNKTDKISK